MPQDQESPAAPSLEDGPNLPALRKAFQADPRALMGQVPGILPVDKPAGMTSHDVVARARRVLGIRRVGHGGTLDPMATGVLLILAGRAARLFDDLQGFQKEYEAGFRLGIRTDTQDTTGTVLEESAANLPLTRQAVEAALTAFRGDILQVPPMYSALKRGGKKLVDLARAGQTVERDPRPVTVHALELVEFDGREGTLRLAVSRGFYVRTLIDDLGQALGPGATMTHLRRTQIGPFDLADTASASAQFGLA